jgi:hypothetical protein
LDHRETIPISEPQPTECTEAGCPAEYPTDWPPNESGGHFSCDEEERTHQENGCDPLYAAHYAGASADGSKVFFTSEQKLVNGPSADTERHLYEYEKVGEVAAHHLRELAGGHLDGVVQISSDGSHVYFATMGSLSSAETEAPITQTNGNPTPEEAQEGQHNLYVFDSESGTTRFVARLSAKDESYLWNASAHNPLIPGAWLMAQTPPDGRYLVFDTSGRPRTADSAEEQTDAGQQIYRYDAETGRLVRVSVGHGVAPSEAYADNGNEVPHGRAEGLPAWIAPPEGPEISAVYSARGGAGDWDRAISGDGRSVAFETAAPLAPEDVNTGNRPECDSPGYFQFDELQNLGSGTGCDVYLWHECENAASHPAPCADGNAGEVSLISQNTPEEGTHVFPTISQTGTDIYLVTPANLVGQDTDNLTDVYDARISGGVPYAAAALCGGDGECKGPPSVARTLPFVSSEAFAPLGNCVAGCEPGHPSPLAVKASAHKVKNGRFLLTITTAAKGVITVAGRGVRRIHRALPAGTHRLTVHLTKGGKGAEHNHRTLRIRVTLTVGQSTATTKVMVAP